MLLQWIVALAPLVATVTAHATFQEMWINGVDQGQCCVRLPASNSPVTDVTSSDLTCNVSPTATSGLCAVNPGDSVTVEMHQQPKDRSCANEAIGGDHYGPINIYMAKVSDATTAVGSSAGWFKINEMGLVSSNPDYWATEVLNNNCGHYTFTIPTGIAPGNYLLRAEVIALHVASSTGGAQFYMSCYQLTVGGSGTVNPPTVAIPGAYKASDPGILINIYTQLNSYVIPGPTPYASASPAVATTAYPTTATWNTAGQPSAVPTTCAGGGGGGGTTSKATTSTSTTKATGTTTTTKGTTTTTTSATSSATGTAALYGQCGGIGWTGPTVCVAGSKCTYSSAYYSQCLPS
ncbi:hypothetical protein DL93DRAFT_2070245 [Clavulina sp. PMI_390]|nr:hypothetical protein DL93DRAFT_2070245 [Clavulina sp. PMI_390]